MEITPEFESHRFRKCKFVRIDAKKRDSDAHAIITCDKDNMGNHIKNYQRDGYEIVNIREL